MSINFKIYSKDLILCPKEERKETKKKFVVHLYIRVLEHLQLDLFIFCMRQTQHLTKALSGNSHNFFFRTLAHNLSIKLTLGPTQQ